MKLGLEAGYDTLIGFMALGLLAWRLTGLGGENSGISLSALQSTCAPYGLHYDMIHTSLGAKPTKGFLAFNRQNTRVKRKKKNFLHHVATYYVSPSFKQRKNEQKFLIFFWLTFIDWLSKKSLVIHTYKFGRLRSK